MGPTLRTWAIEKALEAHRHRLMPDKVEASEIVATAEAFLEFANQTDAVPAGGK